MLLDFVVINYANKLPKSKKSETNKKYVKSFLAFSFLLVACKLLVHMSQVLLTCVAVAVAFSM